MKKNFDIKVSFSKNMFYVSILAFFFTRVLTNFIYKLPFNLYCGDSAFYIHLAQNLNLAAADRPSGYPFILSFLLPELFNNLGLVTIFQTLFSFAVFMCFLFVFRKIAQKNILIVSLLLIFFNSLSIFLERSVMAESISYNLLIVCFLLLSINRNYNLYLTFFIGLLCGIFPILRTNYLVFSFLFIFLLNIFSFKKNGLSIKFFVNLFTVLIGFLVVYYGYINFYVSPRLKVNKISSFGGRTLFSRVMVFSDCNDLINISNEDYLTNSLYKNCDDRNIKNYSVNIFSSDGIINKTDNELKHERALSDGLFMNISKVLIFKNPKIIIQILSQSIRDTFLASSSFFEQNTYPSLGGGCETIPEKFNLVKDDLVGISVNKEYLFIRYYLYLSTISNKIIVLCFIVIIPIYFLIKLFSTKIFRFLKKYYIPIVIWVFSVAYFMISLLFAGFDYRYIHPLWFMLFLILYYI